MKTNSELQELINDIIKFRDKRDWAQFHNLKDLSIGLNIESAELMEHFLWKSPEEIDEQLKTANYLEKIEEELADVIIYCLLIAHKTGARIPDIVRNKLALNAKKYPAEIVKGLSKKYSEYTE